MDQKEQDKYAAQLEQLFAGYEITELSISTLPMIITDIVKMLKAVDEAAYDRGYDSSMEDTADQLSMTKAGRNALDELVLGTDQE